MNNKIRRVEVATGAVTTVAGRGTAGSADGAPDFLKVDGSKYDTYEKQGGAKGVIAGMPHADVLAPLGRDLSQVEAPVEARVGTSFPTCRQSYINI